MAVEVEQGSCCFLMLFQRSQVREIHHQHSVGSHDRCSSKTSTKASFDWIVEDREGEGRSQIKTLGYLPKQQPVRIKVLCPASPAIEDI